MCVTLRAVLQAYNCEADSSNSENWIALTLEVCKPIRRPAYHKILSCQIYNLGVCVCFRLWIGISWDTTLLLGTVEIERDFKLASNFG